jgi:hypothetical protein
MWPCIGVEAEKNEELHNALRAAALHETNCRGGYTAEPAWTTCAGLFHDGPFGGAAFSCRGGQPGRENMAGDGTASYLGRRCSTSSLPLW